jgi:MFS superfamily sulfate permease-like transporter
MFTFKYWRQDLQSSLVVFLVALPLCLGIALASNAPLVSGLIAGIIGGLVVGAFTNSSISVSGPAAGLTVIVVNSIEGLGSFEAFTVAVFFSGILQMILGAVKAGRFGDYFPSAVIKGMLAAIGIILILKQLPHAVGYDEDYMGDEGFGTMSGHNTFSDIMMSLSRFHKGAIIISLFSLGLMILWEKGASKSKTMKLIPGALLAVVGSVLINELFKTSAPSLVIEASHLVQLPFSGVQDFFGSLKTPDWSYLTNPKVYVTAATIAIVGSLESLLSVDAADRLDESGVVTNKNRELIAQGAGNTLSGLAGGLPLTAVIVRTSANHAAGGRTNLAAFLHGIWLFVCVVFIANVLNLIPLASLAAVLLLVGYKLNKPALYKSSWRHGVGQFIPFVTTILAILFTDLLIGIAIGMLVGFGFIIRSSLHECMTLVKDGSNYLIRFYKDVSFLNKPQLKDMLDKIPAGTKLVIDGSQNVYVDHDIEELIEDFMKQAPGKDISVELTRSDKALAPLFQLQHN